MLDSKESKVLQANKEQIEEVFTRYFSKKISKPLIARVANLSAIDHFYRLNQIPALEVYLNKAVENLERYLSNKSFEDNDFSNMMSIFIASITEGEMEDDDELFHQSQDVVIDVLINSFYENVDKSMIGELKALLKKLMNEIGPVETVKVVSNNPEFIRSKLEQKIAPSKQQEQAIAQQQVMKQMAPKARKNNILVRMLTSIGLFAPISAVLGLGATATAATVAAPISVGLESSENRRSFTEKINVSKEKEVDPKIFKRDVNIIKQNLETKEVKNDIMTSRVGKAPKKAAKKKSKDLGRHI